MIELGTLGAAASIAYAINDAGQVVGDADAFPSGPDRAFLYENGTMYDLKTLIPEDSGWSFLIGATDINGAGQVVGWGAIGGEGHAFRLDPISVRPE